MPACPTRHTVFVTPDAAARAYARQHPLETGALEIASLAPHRQSGELLTKKTLFFVANGCAAKKNHFTKHVNPITPEYIRNDTIRNGRCPICGQVYLDLQIRWAFDDAELSVEACNACRSECGLVLDDRRALTGQISKLAFHSIYRVDFALDITAMQIDQTRQPVVTQYQSLSLQPA